MSRSGRRFSWLTPTYVRDDEDTIPVSFGMSSSVPGSTVQDTLLIQKIPESLSNATITRILGGISVYSCNFAVVLNDGTQGLNAFTTNACPGVIEGGLMVLPPNVDDPSDMPSLEQDYNQPWLTRFIQPIVIGAHSMVDDVNWTTPSGRHFMERWSLTAHQQFDVKAMRKVRKFDELWLIWYAHFQGETGGSVNLNLWTDLRVGVKE